MPSASRLRFRSIEAIVQKSDYDIIPTQLTSGVAARSPSRRIPRDPGASLAHGCGNPITDRAALDHENEAAWHTIITGCGEITSQSKPRRRCKSRKRRS